MWSELLYQLQDPNTQWVLFGTLLLGMASGVLGSFALLRKQSLIGDAMAHAALPGVCIAFLLYGQKSLLWFLVGAAISGLIAAWAIQTIVRHSRIKEDSALGLVLSVFFGFGIVLLTYIQQGSSGSQSGLDDFIFGQAASMVWEDVRLITIASSLLLLLTFLFFKEFKLLTFDSQFAKGAGLPVSFLNGLLMTLIVSAVVIGLQTVGVVLMAAMLITPSIAARYWTEKLHIMIILSGVIGGISGIAGTYLSTVTEGMATGPLIILAATFMFLISLIFAPERGLLSLLIKKWKVRKATAKEHVLLSFYDLSESAAAENRDACFSSEEVLRKRPVPGGLLLSVLKGFEKKGFITAVSEDTWCLTDTGIEVSYDLVLRQRMYEMYLMHEMELAHLQQVRKEDLDEGNLSKELKASLSVLLKKHKRLPSLIPNHLSAERGGLLQ
ncbi:iron chelate uptake ABC transporter family permease subunit [Bacillus mangrovi]|uniref:Manganese transport system membrane protein MntC n=1 Tax=Metabacillus mangrovi TaxID=1491830 RepID=A0A7X2S6Z0_9BACI|nr:metal ABC transporter permease [Metabacillus mangrovi]MTH54413.1 iron chelate uptake ABC transporter family permease subunit [Metabacillus mangrovi]